MGSIPAAALDWTVNDGGNCSTQLSYAKAPGIPDRGAPPHSTAGLEPATADLFADTGKKVKNGKRCMDPAVFLSSERKRPRRSEA